MAYYVLEVLRAAIRAILQRHFPLVEPLSIDEAFLDLTGIARDLADGRRIAAAVKQEIRDRERLAQLRGRHFEQVPCEGGLQMYLAASDARSGHRRFSAAMNLW